MITLSQDQVKQLIDGRPDGTTPADIVSGLTARGYQLEGMADNNQTSIPPSNPADQSSAQQYKPTLPAQTGESAASAGLKTLVNLPSSAVHSVISMLSPVFSSLDPNKQKEFVDNLKNVFQHVGQVPGAVADIATKLPQAAASTIGSFVPPAVQQVAAGAIKSAVGNQSGADQSFQEAQRTLTNDPFTLAATVAAPLYGEAKANPGGLADRIGTTVGEAPTNLVKGTKALAVDGTSALYDAIMTKSPKSLDKFVTEKFTKAVRPSVTGKGTLGQIENYQSNALDAVKTIAANSDQLNLLDTNGDAAGPTPRTLNEFAQAIDQTKKNVFNAYDTLQQETGRGGATVQLNPLADELDKISTNKIVADKNPVVTNYAQQMADTFRKRGTYTTQEAQDLIALYNKDLQNFYKNPDYTMGGKVAVDSLIANRLRSGLDSVIEQNTDPRYATIKAKYGALKAIEKDVVHRAIVSGRAAPKGFFDFADIASGAELVSGLITMNPADFVKGVTIEGWKKWIQYQNNPNTMIKTMFKNIDRTGGLDNYRIPTPAELKQLIDQQRMSRQALPPAPPGSSEPIPMGPASTNFSNLETGSPLMESNPRLGGNQVTFPTGSENMSSAQPTSTPMEVDAAQRAALKLKASSSGSGNTSTQTNQSKIESPTYNALKKAVKKK